MNRDEGQYQLTHIFMNFWWIKIRIKIIRQLSYRLFSVLIDSYSSSVEKDGSPHRNVHSKWNFWISWKNFITAILLPILMNLFNHIASDTLYWLSHGLLVMKDTLVIRNCPNLAFCVGFVTNSPHDHLYKISYGKKCIVGRSQYLLWSEIFIGWIICHLRLLVMVIQWI